MADDLRISADFAMHPKTRLLVRRLDRSAVYSVMALWCYAASNRCDGDLTGLEDDEIANAADWPGDASTFVQALRAVRFLDGEPLAYRIHDWVERQPWVVDRAARREKALELNRIRWSAVRATDSATDSGADSGSDSGADSERHPRPIPPRNPPSLPSLPSLKNKSKNSDSAPVRETHEDAPTATASKVAVPDLVLVDGPPASPPRITLDRAAWRFEGVTDEHRDRWQRAAPLVDLVTDQAAAEAWCAANPEKAPASRMERFLVAWFARTQERLRKDVPSRAAGLAKGRPVRTGQGVSTEAAAPQVFPEAQRAPMTPPGKDWPSAYELLEERMAPDEFEQWVRPLQYVGDRGTTIVLEASDSFTARWVRDNYVDLFRDAVIDVAGQPFQVEVVPQKEAP
jgi:hypothetical protein